MTWSSVNVSQVNRYNGTTNEVERVVLFVGYGKENVGKTQPLNTGSDLDKALGSEDSVLKSIISAARDNAGQSQKMPLTTRRGLALYMTRKAWHPLKGLSWCQRQRVRPLSNSHHQRAPISRQVMVDLSG